MARQSKKNKRNLEKVPEKSTQVAEAVAALKQFEDAKFDETVELAMKLGIDPKNSNQIVRGAFSLPHGIGKKVSVIAFCEGDVATAAVEAGALEAGGEELAQKILDGWLGFDVAIAHPSMMRHVGKLGRILGPHSKMPSPKSGTVTDDVLGAVKEFLAGKVEFRNDDHGNIHAVMGKKSFSAEQLTENIEAFIEHINVLKPISTKGIYVRKAVISSTMSPGIPLEVA
ncbi:MAG: 50S ribosomal protein L1 [Planctomycetota bacterium]|nr:50S ribosomal protein L1 [Planctomycetota bacterium]